ncbi:C40 family peptidase [Pseudofrankia inefficax]|uniref:NLP/P60 protein n=1 Tax=Pseudofrankia inefficax (strain DSM 45817 / CECT 9037 / DDB 130130 / EuI1c) TaxID=298654 RepID=E3J774_PSEI1|nr:C40 family peptidase [Pseudofrankia inefficax]ADP84438.1 NLP/P60 protein [Pseudofrankia inefficax]
MFDADRPRRRRVGRSAEHESAAVAPIVFGFVAVLVLGDRDGSRLAGGATSRTVGASTRVLCVLSSEPTPNTSVACSTFQATFQSGADHFSSVALAAVQFACAQIGKPYVWGGNGDPGFDCSGLTYAPYAAAGIQIPRTAQTQYDAGPLLPGGTPLQSGDLVFFGSAANNVTHVGIYLGMRGGRRRWSTLPRWAPMSASNRSRRLWARDGDPRSTWERVGRSPGRSGSMSTAGAGTARTLADHHVPGRQHQPGQARRDDAARCLPRPALTDGGTTRRPARRSRDARPTEACAVDCAGGAWQRGDAAGADQTGRPAWRAGLGPRSRRTSPGRYPMGCPRVSLSRRSPAASNRFTASVACRGAPHGRERAAQPV